MLKLPFPLFLSLRYLRPKGSVVSLITLISVLGVIAGVACLFIVISVMTGFNVAMRDSILGSQAHLLAKGKRNAAIEDWPRLLQELQQREEVLDAQPYAEGEAVLDFANRVLVVEVLGIEPQIQDPSAADPLWTPLFQKLQDLIPHDDYRNFGSLDLSDDHVLVDRLLADGMGIRVGDQLVLHSTANGRELLDAQNENRQPENLIVPVELTVTGILEAATVGDSDFRRVYLPLERAQGLYNLEFAVSGFDLELRDPYRVQRLQQRLQAEYPELHWESWIDRNRALFDAVAMERNNMYLLLFTIIVVAGFCITNTMITVTMQKRSEIGLLKALGGVNSQIVGVFLGQGILVGILGTSAGLVLGYLILLFRAPIAAGIAWISREDLFSSPGMMMLYELPAEVTIVDIMVIAGGSFLACSISSLLPAYFVSQLDAAKALRQESA